MNVNFLNQQMYYKSFNIFNDDLFNFFGELYLKNQSNKYKLYHNYVFRVDHFLEEVTKFVNDEKDQNDHHFSNFYLSKNNKNDYLKNGSLNFENRDVLKFCKIATHLFIGEFNWDKFGVCSLFLTINDVNDVCGWAIDNNEDYYFSNYYDLGLIDKDKVLMYNEKDELIENLRNLINKSKEIQNDF
jgi:hypothetical protein